MTDFNNWIKEQGKVKWRLGGFMVQFKYKDVMCAGMLAKNGNGEVLSVQIRPMKSQDDIGKGCGNSVFIEFKNPFEN